jgi:hypothetical protein
MSVELTRQRRYECALEECSNERTQTSSVDGSYCSRECADRAHGRGLLQDIRQDHRFCWSCFRQRKRIERPTDETLRGLGAVTAEALVGYESPTPAVESGDFGPECTCGAVDHDLPDWGQRSAGPWEWFLRLASERLAADGRRDDAVDAATLADELWADGAADVPLELAVGRALKSR